MPEQDEKQWGGDQIPERGERERRDVAEPEFRDRHRAAPDYGQGEQRPERTGAGRAAKKGDATYRRSNTARRAVARRS